MNSSLRWQRQRIDALRFSVDMLEGAPVETWRRPDGGGIFQTIAGTEGTLFVNWGEWASATAFRRSLSDMLTHATDISDSSIDVFGDRARRICAALEHEATVGSTLRSQGGVDHIETPAARYCTEVISFVRDGVPVLVGYRIAQSSRRAHDEVIGRFLTSIRPLDSTRP